MRSLLRFSLPAFLLVVAPIALAQPASDPPKGQRVFIAGHSFHMPIVQPLGQIAKAAGIEDHKLAGTQSIGGSTSTQHWASEKNSPKTAIAAKDVDVLTLSPHHKLMPDPAIEKFAELMVENNPKGRVLLQASWMLSDGQPKGFTAASRDTADPAELRKVWAPYYDSLRKQAKEFNEKAKKDVVFVVPAGDALIRLRERVKKGEVPGIAKQSDLYRDVAGHGGPAMAVLTAYCHYAVIYGKSPVGLPVPESLRLPKGTGDVEKLNRILQECAWDAVQAEPMSGVKK